MVVTIVFAEDLDDTRRLHYTGVTSIHESDGDTWTLNGHISCVETKSIPVEAMYVCKEDIIQLSVIP